MGEPQGEGLHVFPDMTYLKKIGMAKPISEGVYKVGEYLDKDISPGEPVAEGYRAEVCFKKREVAYVPIGRMSDPAIPKSIGQRIVTQGQLARVKNGITTYKYDGERNTFRQTGTEAYLINGQDVFKYEADCSLEMEIDFEKIGSVLVLIRVKRLGPIWPYNTYQAIIEFMDKTTLNIPGFTIIKPELYNYDDYMVLLKKKLVDGLVYMHHGGQYLIKHQTSLDFLAPVDVEELRESCKNAGFTLIEFVSGPGRGVEEYIFDRDYAACTVKVKFKCRRPDDKRVDRTDDLSELYWPTTESKPAGLNYQPDNHMDDDGPVPV